MDRGQYENSPLHETRYQADLEVNYPFDGLQASPPNPAGLETRPGHGPILSRDDEKISKIEMSEITPRPRQYYSISRKAVWIILAVLGLLMVAIAVGVGVGVGDSKQSASSTKSSTSNSTAGIKPTSSIQLTSSTTITSPASSTSINGGCVNGTTYDSSINVSFLEMCNTNFGTGPTHNTTAADLGSLFVGTFKECMDACALDRKQDVLSNLAAGVCLSVTWNSITGPGFGTCYMKNMTALSIGNSNKVAQMRQALPVAQAGFQSASTEGDF